MIELDMWADRRILWLSQHWILAFSLVYGAVVALPFLAPVFMQVNWTAPARAIYGFYSLLCHQLPERSFFLFGPRTTYGLSEIQAAWQPTLNPLILREFIGNPALGWKVAWSDRMVSMYTSVLLFAWIWWPMRKKIKPLPWLGLILLLLPMAVDGTSHLISDLAGIGAGFRYDNAWLAALSGSRFAASFYGGDALGSFNSWMRLLTGLLFGLGIVWFAFPHVLSHFNGLARQLELKIERAGSKL